jgi:nucleotide-binding universal stress UspA family protein
MPEVLACLDFSHVTERVVAEASVLAAAFGRRVHLLHVAGSEPALAGYDTEDISSFTRDDRARQLVEEREHLRRLADPLRREGIEVVPLLVMGPTVDRILDEAVRIDARFLVLGSHGHGGLRHLLLGSVAEALVRRSPVPVVIVPPHPGSSGS